MGRIKKSGAQKAKQNAGVVGRSLEFCGLGDKRKAGELLAREISANGNPTSEWRKSGIFLVFRQEFLPCDEECPCVSGWFPY